MRGTGVIAKSDDLVSGIGDIASHAFIEEVDLSGNGVVFKLLVEYRQWKILLENHTGFVWSWARWRPSRRVNGLNDLVNQVRLRKLDLYMGEVLNVDSDIIVEGPLIFNVKIGSYLCDFLVDWCITWGGKYSVVHVDNVDKISSIEQKFVHPGLLESYLFYSIGEVLVTHPRHLPIPLEFLDELEDVQCPDYVLGFDNLSNLNVHVKLNVGLRKG